MPTNYQQSRDVLHPIAFNFIDHCRTFLNITLDAYEINAIDFLTRQLVQKNLWQKFKAIYPFVGKTDKTHSLNLKNLDRHKIVWFNTGSLKHDRFGVTNANNGYGNTVVAPSWFSDNDIHLSVYYSDLWQNINEDAPIFGSRPIGSVKSNTYENGWMHTITLRSLAGVISTTGLWDRAPVFTYSCGPSRATNIRFAGTDSSGFSHLETHGFIVGVNGIKCYVNGEIYGRSGTLNDNATYPINKVSTRTIDNITANIPNISQFPFLLFTNDAFSESSGKAKANIRFASIGYSLNDEENKLFYEIVQEFQRILRREVYPIKLKTFEEILREQIFNPIDPLPKTTSIGNTLTFSIKLDKIITQNTKPYREYLSKSFAPRENEKIHKLSMSINLTKIAIFGPVRVFCQDHVESSMSILSFTEI